MSTRDRRRQRWSGRVPEEFGGKDLGLGYFWVVSITRRVVPGWSVKAGYAED